MQKGGRVSERGVIASFGRACLLNIEGRIETGAVVRYALIEDPKL